jgi:hypothetical protein
MPMVKGLDPEGIVADRAAGMTYAEIASKHSISESTVAYHLKLTITRKQGAPVHPDLLRIRFAV